MPELRWYLQKYVTGDLATFTSTMIVAPAAVSCSLPGECRCERTTRPSVVFQKELLARSRFQFGGSSAEDSSLSH